MQHNSSGTVQYWQQIQFQILVNLLKCCFQIFLVNMVVEVLSTLTQKNELLQVVDYVKILAIRMANHPLYPTLSPMLRVLSLLPYTSSNPYQGTTSKELSTKEVKKENLHLGSNADHSGLLRHSHRYANHLFGGKDY